MLEKTRKIVDIAIRAIGSKCFTWCVIAFFVFQSLWLAFSFRYPLCYDENFHFPVTKVFSTQLSPFIYNQPVKYDNLGDLSNGSTTFFHYLMSFPLRLVELFTGDQDIQVIVLRVLCVAMVAFGLYLFYKLFKKIGVDTAIVNVGLLLMTLLPVFIMTSATVNYDNLLFLLTAWYFIICIKIIQSKDVNWLDYAGLVCVGLFATATKSTFLPIFGVSVLYLGYLSYKRFGWVFFKKFWRSARSARRIMQVSVIIAFVVLVVFLSFGYLRDIIVYHSISPSCSQTLGESRCRKNFVLNRDIAARQTASTRPVVPIYSYAGQWYSAMALGATISAGVPADGVLRQGSPLPVMANLLSFGIILAFGSILYSWTSIFKKQEWRFLLVVSSALILIIFLYNLKSYYNIHAAYAMQSRYMLSIVPIILVATVMSSSFILKKSRPLKLGLFVCGMIILTQGGGLITHIMRSNDSWNRDSQTVRQVNDRARDFLTPLVKEWWYDRK